MARNKKKQASRQRKALRKQVAKQHARRNPGVSTLMLVNPAHHAPKLGKTLTAISDRLRSLESKLKGRRNMRKNPSASRATQQLSLGDLDKVVKAAVSSAVKKGKPSRGRRQSSARKPQRSVRQAAPRGDGRFLPNGRVNVAALRRNRRPENRGLIALDRSHRSIRWERTHGKPTAKTYVDRHFASVNPISSTLKDGGLALAGFYGSRLLGNVVVPKLPLVGGLLGNFGPLAGPLAAWGLGWLGGKLSPNMWQKYRAPFLTGAAVAFADAIIRRVMPPGIQGVLGEVPALPPYDPNQHLLPAMSGYVQDGSTGDFNVREAAVGCNDQTGDFNVREAAAGVDGMPAGNYLPDGPTSGYVQDGTSGYVQEGATGDAEDGLGQPWWSWFQRAKTTEAHPTEGHPVVHRPRTHPYRIVIDCPYPPSAHLHRALPAGSRVLALPPHQPGAQPPALPAKAQITQMAPSKPLAGGIFSDE